MLEGKTFVCPWTGRNLKARNYAINHIIPVSVYPTSELWNLVPSDGYFNAHTKRAKMPTPSRLAAATRRLARSYELYMGSRALKEALRSDLKGRFALSPIDEPEEVAQAVSEATLSITGRGA